MARCGGWRVCVSESVCVVVEGDGGRREEVRLVASKNKNPTLRMWGIIISLPENPT